MSGQIREDEFSSPAPAQINNVIVTDPSDAGFYKAHIAEIKGLLERGAYEVLPREEVPADAKVLKSSVIHTMKNDENGNATYKSRLAILDHKDMQKSGVVKEAPTMLKPSIRLIF